MNALTLLSNQNAQALAQEQSKLDTTKPVVDENRPEATVEALSSTPDKKQLAGNALYHTLFVGIFLLGGIYFLGMLTGEVEPGAILK